MKNLNIKILCVAVATAVMVNLSVSAQTERKDWAKFWRYEEANKSVSKPVAVFMGNSITDHWAKYRPEFFADNNFVGRGISGQTSSQMLVRFRRDVIELQPQVVLILAGTNDLAQNNGEITMENALGNIISMVELAELHKIKVIICSVPPAQYFSWRRELNASERIPQFNKMLKAYADSKKIYYLDYYTPLVDELGGIPEKWSSDTLHPNAECYQAVMEPLASAAVAKVLKLKKR